MKQPTIRPALHVALTLMLAAVSLQATHAANTMDLRGLTIHAPLDFSGKTIDAVLDVRGATFKQPLRFDNATFKKRVRFDNATFEDHADFKKATFSQRADFDNVTFKGRIHFDSATFEERADFDDATFTQLAIFYNSSFAARSDFTNATFEEEAAFSEATFQDRTSFDDATFRQRASFDNTTFADEARFHRTLFHGTVNLQQADFEVAARFYRTVFTQDHDFRRTVFTGIADFSRATFEDDVRFDDNTFHNTAEFYHATFRQDARFRGVTFARPADFRRVAFRGSTSFRGATFRNIADFHHSRYSRRAVFRDAQFGRTTDFSRSVFFRGASFAGAIFTEDVAFENATFTGPLALTNVRVRGDLTLRSAFFTKPVTITNANWLGHVIWRDATFADLRWHSDPLPSTVTGRFDARAVVVRKARITSVHFGDFAFFSDAQFGHAPRYSIYDIDAAQAITISSPEKPNRRHPHPRDPGVIFDRNVFEKEADFLRAQFVTDAVFIENHFLSTWNLTHVTFPPPPETAPQANDPSQRRARLCLSYNRFARFVMPRHQIAPEHSWTRNYAPGLYAPASLETSRFRAVKDTAGDDAVYSCAGLFETPDRQQHLSAVYETLEASFRRVNDRSGENEAWYLRNVVERETNYQQADRNAWMVVATRWVSLLLLDIPSRYGIDLVRVVIVSCLIVLTFFMIYSCYIQYRVSVKQWRPYVKRTPYPDQKRVVRFRPFEPLFGDHESRLARPLCALKDGMLISCRMFFQLGLGTSYPETRWLRCITRLEWSLGIFMLIHFIISVKNTLPIALLFFTG